MEPITRIELEMFKKKYPVISYNIPFSQTYNSTTGKVAGDPVGDVFYTEIIGDGESNFVNWMVNATKKHDGKLIFYYGNKVVKSITIEKGCLVNYSQGIRKITDHGSNETVIVESLAISYQKINFGDIDFDKNKKKAA